MHIGALKILVVFALLAGAATAAPREKMFPDDRTLGNPKAPVVVVEYLAPVCPHCARFAATIFPEIKKHYIDTGKVLYVIRIYPLAAADGAVAGLAKCQKPERYYDFLDLAFRKQAMWDPNGYDIKDVDAALVQLAGMAGMKPEDAKRCMNDQKENKRINKIAEDAMVRYEISAVPSVVIDGKVLTGEDDASWPALKTRIDALLAPAAKPSAPPKAIHPVHKNKTVHPVHKKKPIAHVQKKSTPHKSPVKKPAKKKKKK